MLDKTAKYKEFDLFFHKEKGDFCYITEVREGVSQREWLYTFFTPSKNKYSSYFESSVKDKCKQIKLTVPKLLFMKGK